MNAYTVSIPRTGEPSSCRRGIAVRREAGGSWSIPVGEEGRGRKLVRVPLPQGAVVEEIGPTAGLLVSVDGAPGAAAVLVPDLSGFRGGWSARAPWAPAVAEARRRCRAARDHHEWAGPPEGCECPQRATAPTWRVIAEGACAQGAAGRMGGGPVYLVVMQDGEDATLARTGRLYDGPVRIRLAVRGGVATVHDEDAAAATATAAAAWGAAAPQDTPTPAPAPMPPAAPTPADDGRLAHSPFAGLGRRS